MNKKYMAALIILAMSLSLCATGNAATIMASSCSEANVQAAINSAGSGDIVNVPTGTCTWTTLVTVPQNKRIMLRGAGIDSTVITMNPAGTAINLTSSGSRLTGFTFSDGKVIVDGDNWRIDNCKFYSETTFKEGILVSGQRESAHPTGVIDHCIFFNTRVNIYGWAGYTANALWAQPLNLGSGNNAVYVEDCTFTATVFSNAIDANSGGRYVFRYNSVTDSYVEAHSVQGTNRATQKWEIYNNTFRQVSKTMWVPMMIRGGTGVIFNNILTGNWTLPAIALDNVRSCESRTTSGMCDGSSLWDGNQINGYPCRDQIGRSSDQYLWTTGTPYPPQIHEPAYAWNNKHGAYDVIFYQHNCASSVAHIQPGRDYFNNVQKPGYSPYIYPHPLVNSWSSVITTPRNFRISSI